MSARVRSAASITCRYGCCQAGGRAGDEEVGVSVAIRAEGLVKSFKSTRALDGLDLEVEHARVLGLLGPNGAGKTTAVRILATLLTPDAGRAEVDGFDVVTDPESVREVIGLTGQYAAVDELLTGRENLHLIGWLAQRERRAVRRRSAELLEHVDLTDAADRIVKTYSGGMRRRLDLAASLITQPSILFLDEPTTGLDPRSRRVMWGLIRELVSGGTTLLLTTQYLEEADQLADEIVVIDEGRVIAQGTSSELKDQVGGAVLEIRPTNPEFLAAAAEAVAGAVDQAPRVDSERAVVAVTVSGSERALTNVVRRLAEADIELADVSMHRPSLDDVFMALTGQIPTEVPQPAPEAEVRR